MRFTNWVIAPSSLLSLVLSADELYRLAHDSYILPPGQTTVFELNKSSFVELNLDWFVRMEQASTRTTRTTWIDKRDTAAVVYAPQGFAVNESRERASRWR